MKASVRVSLQKKSRSSRLWSRVAAPEQIAKRLCTMENTIKNYLRALLTTTGSSDLSELASFTVTHRVLNGEEHPVFRS